MNAPSEGQTIHEHARLAMSRYAGGDNSAFSDVYDVLAPRLYRYLRHQTRDPIRSEDLLQQTMLQLHSVRDRFKPGAAVTPWAFAIARRILVDNYRRIRREILVAGSQSREESTTDQPTDEVLHAKRVARAIEREIARLPASQRMAFELMQREGLSLREVAETLGVTEDAIKARAHRARLTLRAAMGITCADA